MSGKVAGLPLLDEAQIEALRDALGMDELRGMYGDLPASARASRDLIERAVGEQDMDAARKAAHVLKGVASSFGAMRLAEVARVIELDLPTAAAAGPFLGVLKGTVDDTVSALSRMLGGAAIESGVSP